jgi:hypothetical protein
MTGFTVAAAASIAAGLSIGAAATVGVTLAVEDHSMAPARGPSTPSSPHLVQYGDRCINGHCLPCDSVQGCINKLPSLPHF